VEKNSRALIKSILLHNPSDRTPWTFDFGSCKGLQPFLLEKYKRARGFECSLARYFDYDIWIAMDPDRIHNDSYEHIDNVIRKKIPLSVLHGGIPLSKNEEYDYSQHYQVKPDGGFFDSFGLYYFAWPDNPDYFRFFSPLEHETNYENIVEYPVPLLKPLYIDYFRRDVEYIKSHEKMCAAYSGSLYEWSYYIRGRERIYYDYYDDPSIVELIIEKIAAFVQELAQKNLDCGVDILCFYDDLGDQRGLQINPQTFRKFYKPFYKKIWNKIKSSAKDAYIFLHACGNISELIPDFIECGLDVLHPLQPETMDIYRLGKEYSKDLVFWGTMSNQYTLTRGKREDIFSEVRERVEKIGSTGRLILSPSNTLGSKVPLKNIDCFYEACERYCGNQT